MELPILYKQDKKGEIRYLEVVIEGPMYKVRTGLLKYRDDESKHHTWKEHWCESQYNEGHGSHRTAEQVAMDKAKSFWELKRRKDAMVENMDEALSSDYRYPLIPVELARRDDVTTPCDGEYLIQAKMDGERCVISYRDNGVHIWSRNRKEKPHLDHIRGVFARIYTRLPRIQKYSFDGELIGPSTRNTGRSIVSRREKHQDNDKMVFYCFDLVTTPTDTFSQRWKFLETMFSKITSPCVRLVPVIGRMVDRWDDDVVNECLSRSLQMGYEGVVCKHMDMLYPIVRERSVYAIKVKPYNDEEAVIVGAHEGIDGHEGLIVFEVNNGASIQSITPSWSHERRREAWEEYTLDPSSYVGKHLTIRYREKNEYGNYVEAIGHDIRELDV
jgi:ATP-dependent DNA ligase